ncbi:MAG: hypothetical protein KGI60_04450 [Patescibacteria group bacterium]|nr:hypothetical protein [Patescibacteria group bacterium]
MILIQTREGVVSEERLPKQSEESKGKVDALNMLRMLISEGYAVSFHSDRKVTLQMEKRSSQAKPNDEIPSTVMYRTFVGSVPEMEDLMAEAMKAIPEGMTAA